VAAETHLHADLVSGSRELAAGGADVVAARAAGMAFPYRGLAGGETPDLGGRIHEEGAIGENPRPDSTRCCRRQLLGGEANVPVQVVPLPEGLTTRTEDSGWCAIFIRRPGVRVYR